MNKHTNQIANLIFSLLATSFFVGCSSGGSGEGSGIGTPMPMNKAALQAIHHKDATMEFTYYRGHTIAMVNTQSKSARLVGHEPLAYLDACSDNTQPKAGELRFEQYSYKARGQNGKDLSLACDLMPVSEEWLEVFIGAFPTCLADGLKVIGWEKPQAVIVHSVMMYMHKGRSGRLSLHAPARAVDMSKLELVYNGESRDLLLSKANHKNNPASQDSTPERKFYESFRRCWDNQLVEKHGCDTWKKTGYRGSVGWEDGAHQNHLHLSRPYCPSNANYLGA